MSPLLPLRHVRRARPTSLAGRATGLVCAAWITASVAPAQAAKAPAVEPAAAPSEATRAPEPVRAKRVLFLIDPAIAPARTDAVYATLRAELADVPADVVLLPLPDGAAPAGSAARVGTARRLASERRAVLVMWFTESARTVQLFLLDPRAPGVSVEPRPITSTGPASGADDPAIDSIATITRTAVAAVPEYRPEPETPKTDPAGPPGPAPDPRPPGTRTRPPAPEPNPTVPPVTPRQGRRDRGHARITIDYLGNQFAQTTPWQHGAFLSVGWLSPPGVYLGAGYQITAPLPIHREISGPQFATGSIRRHPIHAFLGFQRVWTQRSLRTQRESGFGFEIEAAFVIDPITRDILVHCDTGVDEDGLCPDDGGMAEIPLQPVELVAIVPSYGFAPRLRFIYYPLPLLGLHVGGGIDVFSNADFSLRCPPPPESQCHPLELPLFAPHRVRPTVQAGLLLRL